MKVFAIVNKNNEISYNAISCGDDYNAWDLFFRYHAHQYPLADAKEAYQAIGYRAVELEITIKEIVKIEKEENDL